MPNFLSPEERFSDRVEMLGYLTTGLAGIFFLVYLGMLFFYAPVQNLSGLTNLGLLLLALSLAVLGLFLPQYKNFARLFSQWIFWGCLLYSYFSTREQGSVWFGLLAVFSLYALWILRHPLSIRLFRPLKPYEERSLKFANSFTFHRIILLTFTLVVCQKGLQGLTLMENDPGYDTGIIFGRLFLALGLFFPLWLINRLQNWARWICALLCLGIGWQAIPKTLVFPVQNYWEYWQALAQVFYFFGLGIYWLFSPQMRQAFRKTPAPK